MKRYDPQDIVKEVIEAHGGAETWNGLEALNAEISTSGFLFTAKRRPVMNHVRVRTSAREPHFTFFDFPGPGQKSELIGKEEVRITIRGISVPVAAIRAPRFVH